METLVLVSVIIPFFNAANTLNRAIESIAQQAEVNFECILVNNNSDDGSEAIALNWVKNDKRFQLISECRQGVMYASNAGSAKAKGVFMARMDADDYAFPYRLKTQSDFLLRNSDYGAVSGMVEYVGHVEGTQGFVRYVNWVNSVDTYEKILNQRFIESPIVNPSAMWRKSVSDKYGLYKSGAFPEDYEMWLRWLGAGVKIGKINEPVIKWYDSAVRLTRTHPIYSDNAFFEIKTQYLAEVLNQNYVKGRKIAVWGASRISRKRNVLLAKYGIVVQFYIDIKKERQLEKPVVYFEDIPDKSECFVLVYMKHHNLRLQIKQFLVSRNYSEGIDYLFVS